MCVLYAAAGAQQETTSAGHPELLTNLFQLRQEAEQQIRVVHPFRIVASVMDVDSANGVLALRDGSGAEFIRVDFSNLDIEPGATVCLEGKGCGLMPNGFGLVVMPGMVVDNDAVHPLLVESGKAFLHSGMNPIAVKWFNRFEGLGLSVEFEGPNLPRQRIPSSALSNASVDDATGRTNFYPGLEYRCYEGDWEFLRDFPKSRPTRTGVATNLDLSVRTRDQMVGLEFNGFISVPQDGVYTFHLASDDGSRLFVGKPSVELRVLSERVAAAADEKASFELLEESHGRWVILEGTIKSVGNWSAGGESRMQINNHDIRVEVFESGDFGRNGPPLHSRVRVSGIYEDVLTEEGGRIPGRLLVLNWKAVRAATSELRSSGTLGTTNAPAGDGVSMADGLFTLRTAAEIKALSPERAKQQLPVSIRGVLTASFSRHWGVVVQDSTGGVFVNLSNLPGPELLRRGEVCQIEGVTGPGLFSPVVDARRVSRLGAGQLPKPLRATWDQLVNGSLDTEYAEIDGFVTAIQDRNLVLLTEGGKITAELREFQPAALLGYEDALIRIRGCFLANFDTITRKLETGSLVIRGAELAVLQSAPRDVFDAPSKSIQELLHYDPKAAPFRLLKINGQVIHNQARVCFLTDGTNAVRVATRNHEQFAVGELVDAVGFLGLGGHPVELKHAVMRKTGRAPLPVPARLAPEELLQARNAGTLVQVDATLINHWREASDDVLELQSGLLAFRAWMHGRSQSGSLPPKGSRLELTGVYVPQGTRTGGGQVSGFGLLLSSPAGIRVLTTPPWWTPQRVLVLAGILAALLCAVLVWNKELHSQVEERGRLLETEIRNRQQTDLHRAAEVERSRIARDLHDDLGTGLTEVSLLASAGLGQFQNGEKIRDRFHAIAEKSRALVSGLDFIIWAIDPKRNSLQSFADYLADYAKELFSESALNCQLRVRVECGAVTLNETERHNLFLAVKEGLNNAIRHARATEVELRISQNGDHLRIFISDNGRGFDSSTSFRGNGLTNLRERLKAMRGQCLVKSQPGAGTTVELVAPLSSAASSFA